MSRSLSVVQVQPQANSLSRSLVMSSQEKEDKVVVLLSGDVINILENNAMPFTIQDYYKVVFYSLLHFYYLFIPFLILF